MSDTLKNTRQKGFSYLLIKGSSVHFRISVPPLLRPIFGCTEFHRTLGTRLLREAKPIAAILGARLGMLFKDTVKRITRGEIVDIEKLNKLVHDMLDSELGRIDRENIELLQGATFVEKMARRIQLDETARDIMSNLNSEHIVNFGLSLIKLACNDNVKDKDCINSKITDLLGNKDISKLNAPKDSKFILTDGGSLYDMFAPVRLERNDKIDLTSADVDALEIARGLNVARGIACKYSALRLDSGNKYSSKAAHDTLGKLYPIIEGRVKQASHILSSAESIVYPNIGDAIGKYLEVIKNDVEPGTLKNYRIHLSKFVAYYGKDTSLDAVNSENIINYVSHIKNLSTTKDGKTTAISSIIAILDATMSFFSKVKKYYRGIISSDFIEDVKDELRTRIVKAKENLYDEGIGARVPFTDHDLSLLFHKKYFDYWTDDEPGRFWIVILLLYTGARLRDIALIQRGDIKITPEVPHTTKNYASDVRHGIPYIDLTNRKREATLKQRKGKAMSCRVIPIHDFVWSELGFKNYVAKFANKTPEDKSTYLFECHVKRDTKEDGTVYTKHTGKLSLDFTSYRVALKIGNLKATDKVNPKKALHGFRNTGHLELTNNIGSPATSQWNCDMLLGHTLDVNMTKLKYGSGISVESAYNETIAYLDYHKRVDLAALANGYWSKHKKPKIIRTRGQNKGTTAPWLLDIANSEGPFANVLDSAGETYPIDENV